MKLSEALKGVIILQKGQVDIISNGQEVLKGEEKGGLKRCGGQGDILSGFCGTMMAWGKIYDEKTRFRFFLPSSVEETFLIPGQ
jgi:ATP-dependent NAD(P)H-hydrate dehydratase